MRIAFVFADVGAGEHRIVLAFLHIGNRCSKGICTRNTITDDFLGPGGTRIGGTQELAVSANGKASLGVQKEHIE